MSSFFCWLFGLLCAVYWVRTGGYRFAVAALIWFGFSALLSSLR